MKQLFLFLMVLSAGVSCSKRTELPVYDIGGAFRNPENFNRSDYFADLSWVVLETTDEDSYLGDIVRYHLYGDTIVFIDRRNRLSAFDANSGDYLYRIGRQGRGPQEYSGTYRTLFLQDRIYVDGWTNEFQVFDTRGRFLKTLVLPDPDRTPLDNRIPERMQMSGNRFVAYHFNRTGGEKRLLETFDADGNVTATIPNHNLFQQRNPVDVGGFAQFYRFDNQVYFFEQPNDTVFLVDNGRLSPRFLLQRPTSYKNTYRNPTENPNAIEFYDFHEYEDYLTMSAYVGDEDFYFICNKATGEVRCFPFASLNPFEQALFYNSLLDQESGELITILYVHEYLDARESGVLPEELSDVRLENLTENDNPILLKIKWKSASTDAVKK
jgi:hypothetical protein